jgi:hypothetical protein
MSIFAKIMSHIPAVLVKNMSDKVILRHPFIAMLYPFSVDETES